MTRLALLLGAVVILAAGCATAGALPEAPSPTEIPGLESAVAADPGDVHSGVRLAAAYRASDRVEEARTLLADLLEVAPEDPGLLAMSGVLAEDAGDHAAARVAYDAVLATGRGGGSLQDEVQRRREIVRRAELEGRVREALAREDEVAQTTPDPATVGVFPFLYEGTDEQWAPLALAIPEMLATDLAVTGRLQVLERIHVQALLTELALGESGRVDRSTAARSGRLLGSGNIVQGSFRIGDGQRIGVDAAVVEVGGPGAQQVDPLSAEDAIARLFDLEKQLALDLHAELGIQLTPAERERINERQTESVQALLEFGRGIAAENAGDYAEAGRRFSAAAQIDPGFTLASTRSRAAERVAVGSGPGQPDLPSVAQRLASQRQAVQRLANAPPAARDRILQQLAAQKRAVISEVLGQDRVGRTTLLELIFRGPGAGP